MTQRTLGLDVSSGRVVSTHTSHFDCSFNIDIVLYECETESIPRRFRILSVFVSRVAVKLRVVKPRMRLTDTQLNVAAYQKRKDIWKF
jgi:hypothetical protein